MMTLMCTRVMARRVSRETNIVYKKLEDCPTETMFTCNNLSDEFRKLMKENKNIKSEEQSHSILYSTGFLSLDYSNGTILEIGDNKYVQRGIVDGSMNALIARSGSGKTTISIQIASNIIRNFKNSCVFMESAEGGSLKSRVQFLSGIQDPEEFNRRFILRNTNVTIESVYTRIDTVYNIKTGNKDLYTYNTGLVDEFGKPIIKYQPTVFILDSLKTILPEGLVDKDGNNMDGATTARINSNIFTKLTSKCKEANIILLIINHISTGGIASVMPQKADTVYLKPGESLPGGKTATYLQNNIIRLDEKSKLKAGEGFDIDGTLVNVTLTKSRTNKATGTNVTGCTLVFNQEIGYDKALSLFMVCKENNLFEGSGAFLRLPGSDIKFSQKSFKKVLFENKELQIQFVRMVDDFLKQELLNRYEKSKLDSGEIYKELDETINSILSGDV